MRTFGSIMKAARSLKGLNQTEVSELIGVSRVQISYYENDRHIPSLEIALKISKKLCFSLDLVEYVPKAERLKKIKMSRIDFLKKKLEKLLSDNEPTKES